MQYSRVCLVPKLNGIGGPASFQHKLAVGLTQRGVRVCYDPRQTPYDALLVIGGTRNLAGLWQARRQGVRIIQRLNGMNWLHRLRWTGVKHFLRAEYGNLILRIIRSQLADGVVYQSQFARDWWERACGSTRVPSQVIYNGVDLDIYNPHGTSHRPVDRFRFLLVEARLGGGYEIGLETAVRLVEALNGEYGKATELMVIGKVAGSLQEIWRGRVDFPIIFTGQVSRENIPEIDRSAHVLYSADIHAACPNSVIEALACGLPVIAFNTGALPELVKGDAGRIVPYGGDPWRLDSPDIPNLARAAVEILTDQDHFCRGARARAEEAFSLDKMVSAYLDFLFSG